MLQILTSKGFLNLSEKTKASFKFISPLFETFPKATSLPFTMLKSEFYEEFGRIDVSVNFSEEAILYLHGLPFQSGEIKVKGIDEEKVSLYYQSQPSRSKTKLAGIQMSSIFTDINIPQTVPYEFRTTITDRNANFTFTFQLISEEEELSYSKAFTTGSSVSTFVAAVITGINNIFPNSMYSHTPDTWTFKDLENRKYYPIYTLSPLFSSQTTPLSTIIIKSYEDARFESMRDFLTSQSNNVVFPTIHNIKFRPSDENISRLLNDYDIQNNQYFVSNNYYFENKSENSLIPCFFIEYIIDAIENASNVLLDKTEINTLFENLIIFCNKSIDSYEVRTNANAYYNLHQQTITPSEHLPSSSLLDFIKKIASQFNLCFDESQQGLKFYFKNNLIAKTAIDITSYQTYPYSRTPATLEGIVLSFEEDKDDNLFADDKIIVIDETKSLPLPFPTTITKYAGLSGDPYPFLEKEEDAQTFRILKWQGLQAWGSNSFPLADNEGLDIQYLYDNYFDKWLDLITKGDIIKKTFVFNLELLFLFLDNENPVFFFNHEEGAVEAVLREFSLSAEIGAGASFIHCIFIKK